MNGYETRERPYENPCVDWCIKRTQFDGKDIHLHAPPKPRGIWGNLYGPEYDEQEKYLRCRPFATRAEALAAYDEAVEALLRGAVDD